MSEQVLYIPELDLFCTSENVSGDNIKLHFNNDDLETAAKAHATMKKSGLGFCVQWDVLWLGEL